MPPFEGVVVVENFQCVELILYLCVEGVVELLKCPFAVTDAPVLVRFPCCHRATSLASQNLVRTKQNKEGPRGDRMAKQTTLGGWFSAGLGLVSPRPRLSMILEFSLLLSC